MYTQFLYAFSELEFSSHEMDSLGMSEHLYSISCGEGAGRAAAFPFPHIVAALNTTCNQSFVERDPSGQFRSA
jgi:hypothetical protein